MEATKRLGIWMDNSAAHLMEFTADPIQTKTIEAKFTSKIKKHTGGKSEHTFNNKEQHEKAEYYKQLGEVIKNYDNVILFGPTNAKTELHNLLAADHHFEKIKIEVQQADKMSDEQQHTFVKKHFSQRFPI